MCGSHYSFRWRCSSLQLEGNYRNVFLFLLQKYVYLFIALNYPYMRILPQSSAAADMNKDVVFNFFNVGVFTMHNYVNFTCNQDSSICIKCEFHIHINKNIMLTDTNSDCGGLHIDIHTVAKRSSTSF